MIVKHEGAKTVVFIGVILDMCVIIAGMFLKNRTMTIVGVSILLAAALLGSIVLVVRLKRRYGGRPAPSASDERDPDYEYERDKARAERKRAPVRELLKNTLLLGGFLTSCVLFVVFCTIKEFILACIVWGAGVGLTLLAFVVMLVRERIQRSDIGRAARERAERRAERIADTESTEYASAPTEPDHPDVASVVVPSAPVRETPSQSDMSGKYRLTEAAVRSTDLITSISDTVECGGQTLSRRYGLYRLGLQSGGETRFAVSAVPYKRGDFVQALFAVESGDAVIVTGSEIRLGGGRYRQACGKVKMCIVDISTMVEKRRRAGDDYSGEGWAVDPDYRYIITADVDGKRVRVESELYYTEGTGIDLLECRGNGVAIFVE